MIHLPNRLSKYQAHQVAVEVRNNRFCLLEGQVNDIDEKQLFKTLQKFTKSQLEKVIDIATYVFPNEMSLINEEMTLKEKTMILDQLRKLPISKLNIFSQAFFGDHRYLLQDNMTADEKVAILKAFKKADAKNIDWICETISKLPITFSGKNIASLITVLNDTLNYDISIKMINTISYPLLNTAKLFCPDHYENIKRNNIRFYLDAAINMYYEYIHDEINEEGSVNEIVKLFHFFKDSYSEFDCESEKKMDYDLSFYCKEYENGFSFIQKGMNSDEILNTFSSLQLIEDRNQFDKLVNFCTKTYSDGYSYLNLNSSSERKNYVLNYLKDVIDQETIHDFCKLVRLSIILERKGPNDFGLKHNLTEDDQVELSKFFKKYTIDSNLLETIHTYVLPLIFDDTTLDQKKALIQEVLTLSTNQEKVAWLARNLDLRQERILALRGINVHNNDRDQKLSFVLNSLRVLQKGLDAVTIKNSTKECIHNLKSSKHPQSEKAVYVIQHPKHAEEYFGPLLDEHRFSVQGNLTTGMEILGRIWLYIQSIQDSKDKENALHSLINALAACIEDDKRVCNQGKTQRLFIAVLQGRIHGFDIDEEAHVPLRQIVNTFCQTHQDLLKDDFIIKAQEFEKQLKPEMIQDFRNEIEEFINWHFND